MSIKELLQNLSSPELTHLHSLAIKNLLKYDYLSPDNVARAWLQAVEELINKKNRPGGPL